MLLLSAAALLAAFPFTWWQQQSAGDGSESFSPAQTNNLKLWYDLSFGTVLQESNGGTEITLWTNKGTFTRLDHGGPDYLTSIAVTPASWPNLPTLVSNTLNLTNPVVRFRAEGEGDGDRRFHYMRSSGDMSNVVDGRWTNGEVFVVLKASQDPANGGGSQPSNSFWGLSGELIGVYSHYPWTDGLIYETFGTSVRKEAIATTINLTNWIIYNIISRPGLYQVRQNGNLIYSGTTNGVSWIEEQYYLGAATGLVSYHFDGWMAEFLCYGNCELSSAERLQTMQYLTNKFGATNFPSLSL